ncbi:MAG: acyloxyacyl hydrolase [Thermoanaerobaculia bacterium]
MLRSLTILTMLVPAMLLAPAARADEGGAWAFSVGKFDIARDAKPLEGGIQYRFRPLALWSVPLTPMVGVSATEDGSAWIYAGLRYDFELSERWALTPNLAVSLYDEGDKGKDLGHVVEFRSGLEISYRLGKNRGGGPTGPRIGLLFYHLSNASISEDNPGSNSLVLTLALGR